MQNRPTLRKLIVHFYILLVLRTKGSDTDTRRLIGTYTDIDRHKPTLTDLPHTA